MAQIHITPQVLPIGQADLSTPTPYIARSKTTIIFKKRTETVVVPPDTLFVVDTANDIGCFGNDLAHVDPSEYEIEGVCPHPIRRHYTI